MDELQRRKESEGGDGYQAPPSPGVPGVTGVGLETAVRLWAVQQPRWSGSRLL